MCDNRALPHGINASILEGVTREALERKQGRLIGWDCRSLWSPRLSSTKGVYLITTELAHDGERFNCELVLKVVGATNSGGSGAYPREAELYRSGLLRSLTGGLVAPRCNGTVELEDGHIGIWMEYVTDSIGTRWPVGRFRQAAFHLGEFTGSANPLLVQAAGSVPRRNLCALPTVCADNLARLNESQRHPLVRRAYPTFLTEGFRKLWEMREPIMDAMEAVPSAVCHGDAQRGNLFASHLDGQERTVAVDWTNMATAPVGLDIATLVHYALVYFDADVDQAPELEQQVFEGYLDGLKAAGWRGDGRIVRFVYTAQLAYGLGLLEIQPVLRTALDESRHDQAESFYGRPLGQIMDRRAEVGALLLRLGAEAQTLAVTVR